MIQITGVHSHHVRCNLQKISAQILPPSGNLRDRFSFEASFMKENVLKSTFVVIFTVIRCEDKDRDVRNMKF